MKQMKNRKNNAREAASRGGEECNQTGTWWAAKKASRANGSIIWTNATSTSIGSERAAAADKHHWRGQLVTVTWSWRNEPLQQK